MLVEVVGGERHKKGGGAFGGVTERRGARTQHGNRNAATGKGEAGENGQYLKKCRGKR